MHDNIFRHELYFFFLLKELSFGHGGGNHCVLQFSRLVRGRLPIARQSLLSS